MNYCHIFLLTLYKVSVHKQILLEAMLCSQPAGIHNKTVSNLYSSWLTCL